MLLPQQVDEQLVPVPTGPGVVSLASVTRWPSASAGAARGEPETVCTIPRPPRSHQRLQGAVPGLAGAGK
jgi:hypothetical protein